MKFIKLKSSCSEGEHIINVEMISKIEKDKNDKYRVFISNGNVQVIYSFEENEIKKLFDILGIDNNICVLETLNYF